LNTEAMAKAYIEDAEYSLKEARTAHSAEVYHRSVRRAQECIELSLKAILRLLGIEYPKQHDVSHHLSATWLSLTLKDVRFKFPKFLIPLGIVYGGFKSLY